MSAVDEVVAAFEKAGWTARSQEAVSGGRGGNPTRVDLVRGRRKLALLVYAWKITGEGKGRTGTNFRIQTTRSHEGDLLHEEDRLTLGFGIDAARDVIAVFDGWTKRATGRSSSVHLKRDLLDEAKANGYAETTPRWDGRAAARRAEADRLLDWIAAQEKRRLVAIQPLSHQVSGDHATATADLWSSPPAAWLREGDDLVIASADASQLLDKSVWRIEDLAVSVTTSAGGKYPRRSVTFRCRRHARVQNAAPLLEGLTGRPTA